MCASRCIPFTNVFIGLSRVQHARVVSCYNHRLGQQHTMDDLDARIVQVIKQCVREHKIVLSAFDDGNLKLIKRILKQHGHSECIDVIVEIIRCLAADGTLKNNGIRNPAAYLAKSLNKGTMYDNGQPVLYHIRTETVCNSKIVAAILKHVQDQKIYEHAFDDSTINAINRICSDRELGHVHGPDVVIATLQQLAESGIFYDHSVKNPAAYVTTALNKSATVAARLL